MPKPTFHNLPPEKRERIIELAIDEFAEHPYRQASLSRLVTRAGIAKGSIYQYFENKFDLYRWLVLDVLSKRRMDYLEKHAGPPGSSFYQRVEFMILAGTGFLLENPKLGRLGARILEPTSDPELRDLNNQLRALGVKQGVDLVTAAQAAGEVRKDFDPVMVSHFLSGLLGWGITDAMLARLGIDLHQLLTEPTLANNMPADELQRLTREALRFIRYGVSPTPESNDSSEHPTNSHIHSPTPATPEAAPDAVSEVAPSPVTPATPVAPDEQSND